MHKEGLFWQNRAYPAGRSTLPALETALTWAGAACCGDAAAQVGAIGPTSVCELGSEQPWDERGGEDNESGRSEDTPGWAYGRQAT
jgi:hypothetical protein